MDDELRVMTMDEKATMTAYLRRELTLDAPPQFI